ncbi:MAG: triose-phosphate isomerase family protein [bacterium]
MNQKFIIANWKQQKTWGEAANWGEEFAGLAKAGSFGSAVVVVCPPTPFLQNLSVLLEPVGVVLGVQDVSPFEDGAHTGFIGVNQIGQFCRYAIVGHSERQEDRGQVWQKAQLCLSANVTPIICFKSPDQYQLLDGAIYALEDPEHISQQGVYRPKNIEELKGWLQEARNFFGSEAPIIYGGSVNPDNAGELAALDNLDGVLVGYASLKPAAFVDIVSRFSL